MTGYLYLAGPMTSLADFNFPAFADAAATLRAAGLPVRSPHEMHGGAVDLPYEVYLAAGIDAARRASAVVLLPGWQRSPGAVAEHAAALAAGVPTHEYADVIAARFR